MADLPNSSNPVAEAEGGQPRTPAPSFLDRLQGPMESIALGEEVNQGRFCGYCYARLAEPNRVENESAFDRRCPVCGVSREKSPPVDSVPSEVFAMYMAKRGREGLFVNLFAFLGIFLSLLFSALLWFLTPENWWKGLPFVVLAIGSYYLARVLGYNAGVPLGSRSGRALRDRRWQDFLLHRGEGAQPPSSPSGSEVENPPSG